MNPGYWSLHVFYEYYIIRIMIRLGDIFNHCIIHYSKSSQFTTGIALFVCSHACHSSCCFRSSWCIMVLSGPVALEPHPHILWLSYCGMISTDPMASCGLSRIFHWPGGSLLYYLETFYWHNSFSIRGKGSYCWMILKVKLCYYTIAGLLLSLLIGEKFFAMFVHIDVSKDLS